MPSATSTQLSDSAESQTRPKRLCSQSISNMFNEPYKVNSTKHNALTKAVGLFILEEGLPEYMVERPAFKKMLTAFDRRYVMFSTK